LETLRLAADKKSGLSFMRGCFYSTNPAFRRSRHASVHGRCAAIHLPDPLASNTMSD
jgi:hypothetical protein